MRLSRVGGHSRFFEVVRITFSVTFLCREGEGKIINPREKHFQSSHI